MGLAWCTRFGSNRKPSRSPSTSLARLLWSMELPLKIIDHMGLSSNLARVTEKFAKSEKARKRGNWTFELDLRFFRSEISQREEKKKRNKISKQAVGCSSPLIFPTKSTKSCGIVSRIEKQFGFVYELLSNAFALALMFIRFVYERERPSEKHRRGNSWCNLPYLTIKLQSNSIFLRHSRSRSLG